MRVFVRRCAVLLVASAIAACGSDSGSPSTTAPTPPPSGAPSPGPAPSPAPQPACSASLPDLPGNVPARGGTFTVSVIIASNCTWNATSLAEGWATITPTSGRGSTTATLRVMENVRTDSRSFILSINAQSFPVIQDGITCVYSLGAPNVEIGNDAGRIPVVVSTQADCRWTATSSEGWIIVRTPSGTGSGTINLDVERNTGETRQAFVTVANQRITITQRRGN